MTTDKKRQKGSKKRHRFLAVFAVLAVLLGLMLWDSNSRLVTEEYTLTYPSLPEAFNGLRIVQLSDVHGATLGGSTDSLLKAVRDAGPDIIAVTGDFIDDEDQLEYAASLMEALCGIAPVYYVSGNHEWAAGVARPLFDVVKGAGGTVLRNTYVTLTSGNDELILAGLDDPNGPADMRTPEEVFDRIRTAKGDDAFIVLLAHRNELTEEYAALGAQLVLSGHGHGGVVRLPFTDGLFGHNWDFFPTYTNGLYTVNGTDFIISRGIGNDVICPRFLNNPHLPVIILRAE